MFTRSHLTILCVTLAIISVSWAFVLATFIKCGQSEHTEPTQVEQAPVRPPFLTEHTITGDSMLPGFTDGETVLLELCDFRDLRGNDTVILWNKVFSIYVHHRLLSRDKTGLWQTRGDNNPGVDRGRMTADDFVGRTRKLK